MKKDLIALVILAALSLTIYYPSIGTFFAQDDFILIEHFSQNNFLVDVKNTFGPPAVSHWRPFHNLYFLVSGNLFGKNYQAYHLLTLVIHLGVGLAIYRVIRILLKVSKPAFAASIIYLTHPAHFVSLFWISGSAATIGFFFLLWSFYLFLNKRSPVAVTLYLISLLASEAMVVGAAIFILYDFLLGEFRANQKFHYTIGLITSGFLFIKFLFLTPKETFVTYPLEISSATFQAIKYYLIRTLGFAEVAGDEVNMLILSGLLLTITFFAFKKVYQKYQRASFIFFVGVVVIGLFPFILIPTHLSPHYMNIAIFGFASFVASAMKKMNKTLSWLLILIFLLVSILNLEMIIEDHWLIKRSKLAKNWLTQIAAKDLPDGSIIIFKDNDLSTSKEAYISLGTGKALHFWFPQRKYRTCFEEFEKCEGLE